MLNLSTLSGQILECLHTYPETRDSDKVLIKKILEVYYPARSVFDPPFDPQSVGRIRRMEQEADLKSGACKIQPTAACTRRKKKLETESREYYGSQKRQEPQKKWPIDAKGNYVLFTLMPQYEN